MARHGSTRAGPYLLPTMEMGGAKTTKGTKKMLRTRLYWPGPKPRLVLNPAVSAFPDAVEG
jgi:hypothetical protein